MLAAAVIGALSGARSVPVHPPPAPPAPTRLEPAPLATTDAAPSSPVPPPASPLAASSAPPDPETSLTGRLRAVVDADPGAALGLADEGERRFGDGPLADERSFLKMRALVHLGRIGDARSEAEAFFERFPESPLGERAYRLTGVHPRPSAPRGRGPGR